MDRVGRGRPLLKRKFGDEGFLGCVVVVEPLLGQPQLRSDGIQRQCIEAVAQHHRFGGLEDRLAGERAQTLPVTLPSGGRCGRLCRLHACRPASSVTIAMPIRMNAPTDQSAARHS